MTEIQRWGLVLVFGAIWMRLVLAYPLDFFPWGFPLSAMFFIGLNVFLWAKGK